MHLWSRLVIPRSPKPTSLLRFLNFVTRQIHASHRVRSKSSRHLRNQRPALIQNLDSSSMSHFYVLRLLLIYSPFQLKQKEKDFLIKFKQRVLKEPEHRHKVPLTQRLLCKNLEYALFFNLLPLGPSASGQSL